MATCNSLVWDGVAGGGKCLWRWETEVRGSRKKEGCREREKQRELPHWDGGG